MLKRPFLGFHGHGAVHNYAWGAKRGGRGAFKWIRQRGHNTDLRKPRLIAGLRLDPGATCLIGLRRGPRWDSGNWLAMWPCAARRLPLRDRMACTPVHASSRLVLMCSFARCNVLMFARGAALRKQHSPPALGSGGCRGGGREACVFVCPKALGAVGNLPWPAQASAAQ